MGSDEKWTVKSIGKFHGHGRNEEDASSSSSSVDSLLESFNDSFRESFDKFERTFEKLFDKAKKNDTNTTTTRKLTTSFRMTSSSSSSTVKTAGEQQYLELIRKILTKGTPRNDRTGTGTLALFGETLTFDLRNDALPLLTVKQMELRPIVGELLWFLRGGTNSKDLEREGIHIWRANGSREVLDKLNFRDREVGDLGPIYGFQWRYAGIEYKGSDWDYKLENEILGDKRRGYDQIEFLINEIRNNPHSRRIFLSSWNVQDLSAMALPPCHVSLQLFVHGESLSGLLYMRSSDVGLGLPFNIASYAILLHLIAKHTGLRAVELKITIGDTHVYNNHVSGLRKLLERKPYDPPTLIIRDKTVKDLGEYEIDDFKLYNYRSHERVKLNMSV